MAQWWRICLPIQEIQVRSLGLEDPLEEGMATRSSMLAWRIWTEEPGGYSPGVAELDATEHTCTLLAASSKSNSFMVFWVLCGGHLPWVASSSSFSVLSSSYRSLTLWTPAFCGHLFIALSWNNILSFCHSCFSVLNIYMLIPTFLLLNIAQHFG